MAEAANMMEIIGFPLYTENCGEASLSPKQKCIESLIRRHKNKRAIFGAKVDPHDLSGSFVRILAVG